MYKTMIVDDEDLIREDLASIIRWEDHQLDLVYSAIDGLDALEHIPQFQPDLIITDIRMPVIDGLELIKQAKEMYPHITFIILSGYSDFSYAQQALKYGVKDYLLKPISEEDINQCLDKTIIAIKRLKEKKEENTRLLKNYETIKNIASEKFFSELLEGKKFGMKSWEYFMSLTESRFGMKEKIFVFLMLYPDVDLYHLFALQNISREIFGNDHIIIDTKFKNYYVFLLESDRQLLLHSKLSELKKIYTQYFKINLTVSHYMINDIKSLSDIYLHHVSIIDKYYYWLKDKIIDRDTNYPAIKTFNVDLSDIHVALKTNNYPKLQSEIEAYLSRLHKVVFSKQQVSFFHQKLLNEVLSFTDTGERTTTIKRLMVLSEKGNFDEFQEDLTSFMSQKMLNNQKFLTLRYSQTTNSLIEIIHKDYANSQLSLKMIANDILYLNNDYLGKKFKQETSIGFNEYLLFYRIENAKLLILNDDKIHVKELSEKVGFGYNSSHFSKTFKKLTHMSPSEFKQHIETGDSLLSENLLD